MKKYVMMAATVALAGTVASAHEGDYGLLVQGGKVVTGIADDVTGAVTDLGTRVFGAELEDNGTFWEAGEPGVFIPAASLPDNTQVSFIIEAALRYWDGTGPVNFSTIPAEQMTLGFGPETRLTPTSDTDVAGFSILYDADAPGGFDEHFDFLVPGSASAGIYLLQMRFSLSGFEDSDSVWTVFNAGLDDTLHDAAIDYVGATYVPAPGASALLGFGGVLAGRRRR